MGVMILFIIQFNSFLTVNRILRSDLDLGIFEAIKTAGNYFIFKSIDLPGYEEAFQRTELSWAYNANQWCRFIAKYSLLQSALFF